MIRNWDKITGDLVTSGTSQFLDGKDSTGHGIRHRLLMLFGEWFLDITDGTPWFQSILGKAAQDVAEAALKQRIITAPGVVAITAFTFNLDRLSRRINVECTVLDINNESVRVIFDEEVF